MGSSHPTQPKMVSHFSNAVSKGETPPFRAAELPLDVPIVDQLPGGIDTMLKAFEYFVEVIRK